jgi:hypothetical protein
VVSTERLDGKVLLPLWVDVETLWSWVFGSGFESCPWWLDHSYLSGNWETPGRVEVISWSVQGEGEGDPIRTEVTPETLIEAWTRAIRFREMDIEDLDSDDGDVVLQLAVYGAQFYC